MIFDDIPVVRPCGRGVRPGVPCRLDAYHRGSCCSRCSGVCTCLTLPRAAVVMLATFAFTVGVVRVLPTVVVVNPVRCAAAIAGLEEP